jgi:hypothetical protein
VLRKIIVLACLFSLAACKTPQATESEILSRPQVNNQVIDQGGKVIGNKCNSGGHAGPTTGKGWPFDAREGCFLDCKNISALKADFLDQLKNHRVYGDINLISAKDPEAGKAAQHFAKVIAARGGGEMNRFDKLTANQLFDGATKEWQKAGIQVGDIFINVNFGQPNHAGIFYSKRGMAHARLVVEVTKTHIKTFDGGWNHFTKLEEVNSQTVWLRPRAKFIKPNDMKDLVKWAKLMEPLDYDNTLTDDWREFRELLHKHLDNGDNNFTARTKAFSEAETAGLNPAGLKASFTYQPPSGLYCSEGAAGIYSYLGFRQYGETAIDIVSAFSVDGSLPDWKLYEDALSGFGADSEKNTYLMHKLFFDYFTVFEAGRKAGAIVIPGLADSKASTFAQAAEANLKAVAADKFGASDHLDKQLEAFEQSLAAAGPSQAPMAQKLQALRGALKVVADTMSKQAGIPVNTSLAIFNVFYANKSYGPHTFFENKTHFEFKGVFYNTNLNGNQALFVSDWWLETFGQPRISANVQTTLYRINKQASNLPADRCVIAEKAPLISTK